MNFDIKKHRLAECKKVGYNQQVEFHKKNVILQSVVSFFLILAGFHFAKKQDPVAPFVIAPSITVSMKKLESSERKRRYYKKMLNDLDREG